MKRILSIAVILSALSFGALAQTSVQGTVVSTSTNRVSIYAKPNSDILNKVFRNINICVSIADQGAGNPTAIVDTNYIPSLNWDPQAVVISGGRAYYTFIGTDNGTNVTSSWNGAKNNKIATIKFSNGNGYATAQINDETPTGGSNGQMFWYVEIIQAGGGDVTDYNNKFYGTNPVPVNSISSASFVGSQATSILPAFLQDFNVIKKGDFSASVDWITAQEQNVSHFILERSTSQTGNWQKVTEVKAKGNSNTPTKYSYLDQNVFDGNSASKTFFYRIRTVDLDAAEKISQTRTLRFTISGGKEITIYPNPVKDGFTINVPVLNPQNKKIKFNLINQAGQLLHAREISAAVASNYYYNIKTPGVIAGEYMLQIIMDGELLDTKKIIVQR